MKKLTLFLLTTVAVSLAATYAITVKASIDDARVLIDTAPDPVPTPDPAWRGQMLSEHNALRQRYNVSPLVWDDALANGAQAWAERIALRGITPPEHRESQTIGENIVWGTAGLFTPQSLIERWSGEARKYDQATNTCTPEYGCLHFTQVVWSTTTKLGCGKATTSDGKTDFVVCNYSPTGNVRGQNPLPSPSPIYFPSSARTGLDNDNLTIVSSVYNDNLPASTGVPATPGTPASEGTKLRVIRKGDPTPTPNIKVECDDCSAVQQLTAKVDQLKAAEPKPSPKSGQSASKTVLLFPFVTNQSGFDTGISIANTSADTLGTKPTVGNCELSYFGNSTGGGSAPRNQLTTYALHGGQTMVFSLSSGGTNGIAATPGFQGYIIATCNFPYARGFAFISDVGSQKLAMGYLAEIVPDPRTP